MSPSKREHNMVIRVYVETIKGERNCSPCVFSTEEKAHDWAAQFGAHAIKTFQYFPVDNWYTEAHKSGQ